VLFKTTNDQIKKVVDLRANAKLSCLLSMMAQAEYDPEAQARE